MDPKRGKLAPEFIDLHDWHNMTRLFVHLARNAHDYVPGHAALRQRLAGLFERAHPLFEI